MCMQKRACACTHTHTHTRTPHPHTHMYVGMHKHTHTHMHHSVCVCVCVCVCANFDVSNLCLQVSLMKKIAETSDLSEVVDQLRKIASSVLNKNNIRYKLVSAEALLTWNSAGSRLIEIPPLRSFLECSFFNQSETEWGPECSVCTSGGVYVPCVYSQIVTVGNSSLHCCVCETSFKHWLTQSIVCCSSKTKSC